MRVLPPLAFALLAIATVAAFAVAQRLKTEPPLIDKVELSPLFTPDGDRHDEEARVRFRLTRSDRANVQIVDLRGRLVLTLARNRELNDFKYYVFHWDGRTRTGSPAPPGAYRLRVVFLGEDRSLVPTGRIRLRRPGPGVSGDLLAGAGVLAASAGAVLALLWPPGTRRSIAMLLALALLVPLVLGDQWESARVSDLRDDPERLGALVALAALAVAALTALFRRRPDLLPLVLIAALPFRIPLHSGGGQANLLIPLYVVITAAVIAAALESRGDDRAPPLAGGGAARWLPGVLAAIVSLYAVQSLYSEDFSKGLQNICFFMVPFSVLFVLLAEQRWDSRLLRGALVVVLAEASIFAAFGLAEYAVRDLLWNPGVIRSNELHTYFRVNSLFWDPNIYGRYLALALLALVSLLLWTRSPRLALAAAGLSLLLWLGLATTFSQSSFIALLGGLAVIAALRWSLRWTALACAGVLLAGLVVVLAGGASLNIDLSTDEKLNKDTSGRANLVSGGLELLGDRPGWGYGSGSFAAAFREQGEGGRPAALAASHTEPVTVAAEQGAIGLLAYLALLAVAFATLIRGLAPQMPGISRAPPRADPQLLARVIVLAAFTALVLHTLAYAAFLTDPITWALLAIGGALMPSARS